MRMLASHIKHLKLLTAFFPGTVPLLLIAAVLASIATCSSFSFCAEEAKPVKQDFSKILEQLEKVRELKFTKKVPSENQSLEDFEKFVRTELEKSFPPDKRNGTMQGLLKLGMITEPFDLGDKMVKALLSQAAAYYNPATGTFYMLFQDMPENFIQGIAAHEMVHALQDQNFKIGETMKKFEGTDGKAPKVRNDDLILAFRYLVEGEATYVMQAWQMEQMMPGMATPEALNLAFKMTAQMDTKQLLGMTKAILPILAQEKGLDRLVKAMEEAEKLPKYIIDPLTDAYMGGAAFVSELRASGGWKAVDQCYKNLPASAEQCVHPDKANDVPTPIELGDLSSFKGAEWLLADSAIHGERYLRLLLQNFETPFEAAKQATAGWDGDIYRAYTKGEQVVVVLATIWDSADDATEFFAAYRKILGKKYKDFKYIDAKADQASYDCGDKQGQGIIHRIDERVFMVEGGSAELNKAILEELKALKIEQK